jgi:enamine deaminase RidA (YjgF/YER057c/UK114 family)
MRLVENRLKELGIILPSAAAPLQNYVPFVRTGNLLAHDGTLLTGKLAETATLEAATLAAERAALGVIAQIKAAIGNLNHVERIVKLNGFVHAAPDAYNISVAMNGASDIFVNIFGERGRHARSTIGASPLPRNALCEIDAIIEVA